jgi:hypothetical protein
VQKSEKKFRNWRGRGEEKRKKIGNFPSENDKIESKIEKKLLENENSKLH